MNVLKRKWVQKIIVTKRYDSASLAPNRASLALNSASLTPDSTSLLHFIVTVKKHDETVE